MVRHSRHRRSTAARSDSTRVRSESSSYRSLPRLLPRLLPRDGAASGDQSEHGVSADSSAPEDGSSFLHVPISQSRRDCLGVHQPIRDLLGHSSPAGSSYNPSTSSSSTYVSPRQQRCRRVGVITRSSRANASSEARTSPNNPPAAAPAAPRSVESPAPRRPRPLVPPGTEEDDEEDPCSICLDKRSNEAAILYCMHRYCFVCIKRWAEGSNNTCPLCKMIFSEIAYNIRSDTDYDVYKIKQRRSYPPRSMFFPTLGQEIHTFRPVGIGTRLDSGLDLSVQNQGRPEHSYIQLHMARQLGMMEMRGMRGENMMSARVMLYQHGRRTDLSLRQLDPVSGPPPPIPTPEDFCVDETLTNRMVPFLFRELTVVFALIGNVREQIITDVRSIVRIFNVTEEAFGQQVRNAFTERIGRMSFPPHYVSIFVDELISFICNNQEIEDFDRLNRDSWQSSTIRRRRYSPSRNIDIELRRRTAADYYSEAASRNLTSASRNTYFSNMRRLINEASSMLSPSSNLNGASPEDLSSPGNTRPLPIHPAQDAADFGSRLMDRLNSYSFPAASSAAQPPAPPPPPGSAARPDGARPSSIGSTVWSSLAHENLRERMRLMDSGDEISLNLVVDSAQRYQPFARNAESDERRATEERRSSGTAPSLVSQLYPPSSSGDRPRRSHPAFMRSREPVEYLVPQWSPYPTLPPPPDADPLPQLPDLHLGGGESAPSAESPIPAMEWPPRPAAPAAPAVPAAAPAAAVWPCSPPLLSPIYSGVASGVAAAPVLSPVFSNPVGHSAEASTSRPNVDSPASPTPKTEAATVEAEERESPSPDTPPAAAQAAVIEISSDEEEESGGRRRKARRSRQISRDDDCVILGQSVEIVSSEGEAGRPSSSTQSPDGEPSPWRPWQRELGHDGPSVPQLIAFKQQRASSASESSEEDDLAPRLSSSSSSTSSTEPMQLDGRSPTLECGSSVYIHSHQGRMDLRRQKRRLRRRRKYFESKLRYRQSKPFLRSAVVVPPHSSLNLPVSPPPADPPAPTPASASAPAPAPAPGSTTPELLSVQDVSQVLSVIEMGLPPPAKPSFALPDELERLSEPADGPEVKETVDLTSPAPPDSNPASLMFHRPRPRLWPKELRERAFIDLSDEAKPPPSPPHPPPAHSRLQRRHRRRLLRQMLAREPRRAREAWLAARENEEQHGGKRFRREFPRWRDWKEAEVKTKKTEVQLAVPPAAPEPAPVKRKVRAGCDGKKRADTLVVDLAGEEETRGEETSGAGEREKEEEVLAERGDLRALEYVYPRNMEEFYRSVRGEALATEPVQRGEKRRRVGDVVEERLSRCVERMDIEAGREVEAMEVDDLSDRPEESMEVETVPARRPAPVSRRRRWRSSGDAPGPVPLKDACVGPTAACRCQASAATVSICTQTDGPASPVSPRVGSTSAE